ncbi:hypothetical protein BCR43DRAFT_322604 [Syncephalastrum racemosum]|uniref:Uncharacterized protein n=1 Tax=Syncephalastrum racemosum TaxID=13706 RepID=A0A1X2H7F6_SYNRA|nr:hypothetical protein BCR43DRAFT_322604 [Syncephalastrum racemosum]
MTSIIQRDLGYDVGNSADGSDRGGGVGPYSCSSASMMYQDRIQGRQGYMQGESTIEQWRHERGVLGSTRRIWIPETVAALNHGGKDPQETMVGKSSSNIATGTRSDIYHKWSAGNMPSGTLDVRPDLENIRSGRIGDIVRLDPSCDEISDGGEHGAQDLPFPPPSPPRASLLSPPHHASSVPPLLAPSALFGGFHHSQQQDLAVSRYRPDYRPECENNEDQTRSVHGMMAGLEHVVNHYHQATTMVSPATLALGSAASAPSLASAERPKAAIRMLASMSTSAENMPSGSGTSLSAMQDGEVPSTTSTSSVASTSAAESSRCVP